MSDTFKAAVLFELNKPLEIVDLYHKDPSDGEVKIKMITSGLCGAQVNEMSGKKGDDKYLPHLMGHEGYGEVVGVGKDVTTVKAGDHVILHWRPGNGISTFGTKYQSVDFGPIGAGPVTTFAEFTIISENRCSVIEPDASIAEALPLLGCAISTAYGAVVKEAKVEVDNDVLIYGAGGLGMALLFWCKLLGIKNITVVDIHDGKRPQIEDFGGTFINASVPLNEKMYDVIFETSGVVKNVEDSLRVAKKSAKIILIGQTRLNAPVTFSNFLHFYDEITMIASAGGRFDPDEDMEKIYSLCKQNVDLFNSLVSQTINLDQVNEGFDLMKAENTKRIIINF